jgi:hypothetical protein
VKVGAVVGTVSAAPALKAKLTGIVRGVLAPAASTLIVPWQLPAGKAPGFACTFNVAGVVPLKGLTLNHAAPQELVALVTVKASASLPFPLSCKV